MRVVLASMLIASLTVMMAQSALSQEAAPPTKVAVVNLATLFTNYAKAQAVKKEMEAEFNVYRTEAERVKADITRFQQIVSDPKVEPEEKNTASAKLVQARRKMEDLDAEVRRVAGKKQEKFVVDLYGEIEAAIQRHADANNIDLVLSYSAPDRDQTSYINVTRKISATDQGGIVPIFVRPRLDITQAVLQSLNEAYSGKR